MLKKSLKIVQWILIALALNEGITSLITREYVTPMWCFLTAFYVSLNLIYNHYSNQEISE